eukprot:2563252-Pyramimonas_sp.AAC.1
MEQGRLGTPQTWVRTYWELDRDRTGPIGNFTWLARNLPGTLKRCFRTRGELYRDGPTGNSLEIVHARLGTITMVQDLCGTLWRCYKTYWGLYRDGARR